MEQQKKSSIEFLGYELNTKLFFDISPELWQEVNQIFKTAQEIHKKEIEEAFDDGEKNDFYGSGWIINGKQYYKNKYEK